MTSQPILIKRYAHSRLYHPSEGRYVSLADLRRWKRAGIAFVVRDSETGTDITRVLLA